MSKMTAPKRSGNSTTDTPILVMYVGDFQVEVASESEDGDKDLRNTAKEIRKRYNGHDEMLARETRLVKLLRELCDEVDSQVQAEDQGNPMDLTSGSTTVSDMNNADFMTRIRKEIGR